MPAGLRCTHRVAAGTWGRITVHSGELRFVAQTAPVLDVVLAAGSAQPIPPEVEHEVQPLGAVRFSIEFLSLKTRDSAAASPSGGRSETINAALPTPEEGGESACFAHLLCPECDAVLDGGAHNPGCPRMLDQCIDLSEGPTPPKL
jgi:tellurite resistance-related uncharacterized protein